MARPMKIALCQMLVSANKAANIAKAVDFVERASKAGAELVVLPECFNAPYGPKFFPEYAEPVPSGETSQAMAKAASANKVWLVAGSIAERRGDKLYNTSVTYTPEGAVALQYSKIHLFRLNTEKLKFDEGETLSAGDDLGAVELPNGVSMGVQICFDLRFPQLSTLITEKFNTSLMICPGAFNMVTGPPHWELLARARAVDNQQFFVFCSPARDETASYVAYGHSLVVDPWGRVVAEAGHEEEMVFATIDFSEVAKIRAELPVLSGVRHDAYAVSRL